MTWESDHVESARARGVSWFHVAQQVGKTVEDIRNRYDPERSSCIVLPDLAAIERDAPTDAKPATSRNASAGQVRRLRERLPFNGGTRMADVLAYVAAYGALNRVIVGDYLKCTPDQASCSLSALRSRGLVWLGKGGWEITDDGRTALEEIAPSTGKQIPVSRPLITEFETANGSSVSP